VKTCEGLRRLVKGFDEVEVSKLRGVAAGRSPSFLPSPSPVKAFIVFTPSPRGFRKWPIKSNLIANRGFFGVLFGGEGFWDKSS
jgi:hypothetical protein